MRLIISLVRAQRRSDREGSMGETALRPITVTVATALAITGIGRTKFYELVRVGRVKTVAIGRRTLVVYADLEKLVEPAAHAE
jgi:excisionase family DNA binding protein